MRGRGGRGPDRDREAPVRALVEVQPRELGDRELAAQASAQRGQQVLDNPLAGVAVTGVQLAQPADALLPEADQIVVGGPPAVLAGSL